MVLSHAGQTSKLRAGILDDGTAYYLAPTVQPNPAKQKRDPSDFNPIEKAFAKLKAHLRRAAERSVDALWKTIMRLARLFTPTECANFFAACGYDQD